MAAVRSKKGTFMYVSMGIIYNAIAEWRLRLTACVNAHGGHFEFKL